MGIVCDFLLCLIIVEIEKIYLFVIVELLMLIVFVVRVFNFDEVFDVVIELE